MLDGAFLFDEFFLVFFLLGFLFWFRFFGFFFFGFSFVWFVSENPHCMKKNKAGFWRILKKQGFKILFKNCYLDSRGAILVFWVGDF